MLGSLFTGAIGFIFAFVAHAKNTEVPGLINFQTPAVSYNYDNFIIIIFMYNNFSIDFIERSEDNPFCIWNIHNPIPYCQCEYTQPINHNYTELFLQHIYSIVT